MISMRQTQVEQYMQITNKRIFLGNKIRYPDFPPTGGL